MKRIIILILFSIILIKNNTFFAAAITEKQRWAKLSEKQKLKEIREAAQEQAQEIKAKAAKADEMKSEEKPITPLPSPNKLEVTPLQKVISQKVGEVTGLPTDIGNLIASYSEQFNSEATKELFEMLLNAKDLSSEEIIQKINEQVKKGANVNFFIEESIDKDGGKVTLFKMPLRFALGNFYKKPGFYNIINTLIKNGAKTSFIYTIGNTPYEFIHGAIPPFDYSTNTNKDEITKEIVKVIKLLLENGLNPNHVIMEVSDEKTGKFYISVNSPTIVHNELSYEVAKLVASYTEKATKDLVDILLRSNDLSSEEIIQKINEQVQKGADVNGFPDKNKFPTQTFPLFIIIDKFYDKPGFYNIVDTLIKRGAKVNIPFTLYHNNTNIITHLTSFNFLMGKFENKIINEEIIKVMKLLIDHGIDPNFIIAESFDKKMQKTFLIEALKMNLPKVVRLLLNNGADPKLGSVGSNSLNFEGLLELYEKNRPEIKEIYKNWIKIQKQA